MVIVVHDKVVIQISREILGANFAEVFLSNQKLSWRFGYLLKFVIASGNTCSPLFLTETLF